ncbi:MAG: Ig-like domain-containing protein [Ruthenibacterium sp.]
MTGRVDCVDGTNFTAEDGKEIAYYLRPAPDNTRFPLRITVRDARTFKPVEGMTFGVCYDGYHNNTPFRASFGQLTTDANGYCEIPDLVVGDYDFNEEEDESVSTIVIPKGYSGFDKPIEKTFGSKDATPVEMTWYLTPDPDTDDTRYITGQKLDENGNPIAGAVYRMTGRDLAGKDVPPRTATTDANGKILFDNVSLWDDPTITVSEITQNSEYVLTKDITKVFDINKMWEPCGLDFVDRAKRAIKTTGISLSDTAISLNAAGTKKLTATSTPANTTDKPVVWQSSNPAVATVSNDGTVTGVSSGVANITVTAAERPGISKTCKVSVIVPVESVNITDYSVSLLKGKTKKLAVTVNPQNATDKAVTWSSDNTAVATVSDSGIVTAKSVGTANITATSKSNKSAKSSRTVTVTSNEVVDITLSAYDVSIVKGDSTTIYAAVVPNDALDKNITWTSGNNSVATVSNGTIKGLKVGSTTITARASNGIQKTCSVSVVTDAVDVTVVRLHPSAYTMDIGESSRVSVEISPYNATNHNITWTSSNSSVATVDNGVVTAVNGGSARITATAHNGVSAFYDVSVKPKESERIDVTSVQLSTPSATLTVGDNFSLVATIEPTNASDLGILWSSSDSNVVSLTHGGDIKAVGAGVATVTATSHNGITAPCVITVNAAPTQPAETGVAGFVERLYTEVLGRGSDAEGKANWIRQLQSKANTGAQAAQGFIMSSEMKSRGLSDEDFLKVMYRTFFNRDPDSGGFAAWMGNLSIGISREFVLCGFANSSEFAVVCNGFGIEHGTITSAQSRDKNGNLTAFVTRLYTKLLDRSGEEDGLNVWTNQILSGAQTPQQVAHGFVFSKEFESKNLNNEKYVEYMYRTFMGREYDAGGKANWVKALNDGKGREYVFNGFANSVEFAKIVKSFGL